jgi:hypothetical protein
MKNTLTLIALMTAASPALAHGDTPIHAGTPAAMAAAAVVLVVAAALAWHRSRA